MQDSRIIYAETVADILLAFGLSRPAGLCLSAIWRTAQAPCADDLVASLGLARSNVSSALKDLKGWGLISVVRAPGDRKEYFAAPADPWDIGRLLMAGHERRVIAAALDRLAAAETATGDARLAALHDALETVGGALAGLGQAGAADVEKAFARLGRDTEKPRKKKKKR